MVRVTGDPLSYAPAVQRIIQQVDPDQPTRLVHSMNEIITSRSATGVSTPRCWWCSARSRCSSRALGSTDFWPRRCRHAAARLGSHRAGRDVEERDHDGHVTRHGVDRGRPRRRRGARVGRHARDGQRCSTAWVLAIRSRLLRCRSVRDVAVAACASPPFAPRVLIRCWFCAISRLVLVVSGWWLVPGPTVSRVISR